MNRFDYVRPGSVEEALAAGAEPGSVYLAGGTNLVDLMKLRVARPARLVDVSRLPGLDRIEPLADGGFRVGAAVRNSDLAWRPEFRARFPAVCEALLSGASGQLRNAATVGGNLLQKTRCAYFQDPDSACNRRAPGSGCDALRGENRLHAVLGWSERCIATHPSDFCVPLAALDAVVETVGPRGRREIPFAEFHRSPGETPEVETALAPGELILAVRIPGEAAGFSERSCYLKVRERTSYAFAVVSAAAFLVVERGRIMRARLAFGGLAARPWRAEAAERRLEGEAPDESLFLEAGRIALSEARPSGDNAFKIVLARNLAARALARAAAGAPDTPPALPASPFAPVESRAHVL